MKDGGSISEPSTGSAGVYVRAPSKQQPVKGSSDGEQMASFPDVLCKAQHAHDLPMHSAALRRDASALANARSLEGQAVLEVESEDTSFETGISAAADQVMEQMAKQNIDEAPSVQVFASSSQDGGHERTDVALLAALAVASMPKPVSNRGNDGRGPRGAEVPNADEPVSLLMPAVDPQERAGKPEEAQSVLSKAVVLRKETHISSALPSSVSAQIAAKISAAVTDNASEARPEPFAGSTVEIPTPSLPNPPSRAPKPSTVGARGERAREAVSELKAASPPGPKASIGEAVVAVAHKDPLPPADPPAVPVQQIAKQIGSSAPPIENASRVETPNPFVSPMSAPTKVLSIQLQPAELGTVVVRMTLRKDSLEIHLEVSRQETAKLISNDGETLKKILQSSGYAVDGVTLRVTNVEHVVQAASGASSPFSPQLHTGSQSGWSQPDAQTSSNRGGDSRGESYRDANNGDRNEQNRGAGRLGGDLYL